MSAGFVALALITCLYVTLDVRAHGLSVVLGSQRLGGLSDAHMPLARSIVVVVEYLCATCTSGDARTVTLLQQPHVLGKWCYGFLG